MIQGYSQYQALPEQYNFGFPYMTDFRVVTDVNFAIQHNGIYSAVIGKMPPHIEAVLGKRPRHTLYSNQIKFLTDRNV